MTYWKVTVLLDYFEFHTVYSRIMNISKFHIGHTRYPWIDFVVTKN